MAGYVRQDTTGNISTGNIIEADDLNAEFDAVVGAFNAASGHTHDGTSAEGAPIEVVGPAQDVVITTSVMRPKTDNTIDLGTSSLKYKDVHSAGTAFLAAVSASGNVTIGGTLGVTGLITATGGVSGSVTSSNATITGGTINNTVIGGVTAAAANFTTVGTSGNVTIGGTLGVTGLITATGGVSGNITSSSATITGGTINNTTIGATTASTGAFTTLSASTSLTTPVVTNAGTLALSATGANIVTASTNGVERLRIDSAGNVGVGTSAPDTKLQVTVNSPSPFDTVQTAIKVFNGAGNGGAGSRIAFRTGEATAWIQSLVAGGNSNSGVDLVFGTPASGAVGIERLRITSAGNVGIGTSAPNRLLVVEGSSTGSLEVAHFTNSGEGANVDVFVGLNTIGSDSSLRTRAAVVGGVDGSAASTNSGYFSVQTRTAGTLTEKMRITSAGSVGIGTSAPSELLQVNGSVRITGGNSRRVLRTENMSFSNTNQRVDFAFIGNPNPDNSVFGSRTHAHEIYLEGDSLGYSLVFNRKRRGSGGGAGPDLESLRIDDAGNVLVGTTTSPSGLSQIVAGNGIFLGGTAAANKLDDYEEGTWTCTLRPTSGFTPTSNTVTGHYTKVGRIVTVMARAVMTVPSSLGTYGNNNTQFGLDIDGLPFTISNIGQTNTRSAPALGVATNLGTPDGYLAGAGSNNTTVITVFKNNQDGTTRRSPTLTVNTNIELHFQFTYFA